MGNPLKAAGDFSAHVDTELARRTKATLLLGRRLHSALAIEGKIPRRQAESP
jgi:hypothetical protein